MTLSRSFCFLNFSFTVFRDKKSAAQVKAPVEERYLRRLQT